VIVTTGADPLIAPNLAARFAAVSTTATNRGLRVTRAQSAPPEPQA
jgi:hypothetical protein